MIKPDHYIYIIYSYILYILVLYILYTLGCINGIISLIHSMDTVALLSE